jgi:hypothetical protein
VVDVPGPEAIYPPPIERGIWLLVNQMIRWYGIKALLKYRGLIMPKDP